MARVRTVKWLCLAICCARVVVAAPTEWQQNPIVEEVDDECDASDDLQAPAPSPSDSHSVVTYAYHGVSQGILAVPATYSNPSTTTNAGIVLGHAASVTISSSSPTLAPSSISVASVPWSSSSLVPLSVSTTSILPTIPSSPAASNPSTQAVTLGVTGPFRASFTQYGLGDTFGTQNCSTRHVACGMFADAPEAAASENLYGAGIGGGVGPACGGCWKLTTDAGHQVVVRINNLCPAKGNPLCGMKSLSDTNTLGANVNFDLCMQDGATVNMFNAVGPTLGTAVYVSCESWSGHGKTDATD